MRAEKSKRARRTDASARDIGHPARGGRVQKKLAGVAAVDRAITILNAFEGGNHSRTLSELMEATGLHGSTILRLLATLERRKFIVRLNHGIYRLGSQLLTLGMIYQKSFRLEEYILPVLHRLSQQTGESAGFSVPDGDTLLVLMRVNSPQPVREDFSAGHRTHLHAGAAGKVTKLFGAGLARIAEPLLRELPIVMIGGIYPHVGALAGPVFDSAGKFVGVIAISGPKERFTTHALNRLSELLLLELRDLAVSLGVDPSIYRSSKPVSHTRLRAIATTRSD